LKRSFFAETFVNSDSLLLTCRQDTIFPIGLDLTSTGCEIGIGKHRDGRWNQTFQVLLNKVWPEATAARIHARAKLQMVSAFCVKI